MQMARSLNKAANKSRADVRVIILGMFIVFGEAFLCVN
jgi:hypothetical protein